MKTSRSLSINNSLSTGLCNFDCSLCGVNKPNYKGPKGFQAEHVTKKLIDHIQQAARNGIKFRLIANSGSGEPTLHPEFESRIRLFGDMIREWPMENEAPEVSIVTNGSNLLEPQVYKALIENPITVNISFPSSDEEKYLKVMFESAPPKGEVFSRVVKGIDTILGYHAEGKVKKVYFHISPPIYNMSSKDFADTLSFLCERASLVNLERINIVMFPNISNRSGLVDTKRRDNDSYVSLFNLFNQQKYHNVQIKIQNVWHRFFRSQCEIEEIVKVFKHPCIWNANLFITAEGDSVCCNDQEIKCKLGNIVEDGIDLLFAQKEGFENGAVCNECNQRYSRIFSSEEIIKRTKINFSDGF